MSAEIHLRVQLIHDLERLHVLILRHARGDRGVHADLERLEGAIQIKFALWRAARSHSGKHTD